MDLCFFRKPTMSSASTASLASCGAVPKEWVTTSSTIAAAHGMWMRVHLEEGAAVFSGPFRAAGFHLLLVSLPQLLEPLKVPRRENLRSLRSVDIQIHPNIIASCFL